MPWEPERNIRSLSPHGIKEAEGHAARGVHDVNSVPCPEMPPGITGAPFNPDPHARGFKRPVGDAPSAARPRDEPREMRPPHDPAPHPYNPAGQKQQANTYAKPRWEK